VALVKALTPAIRSTQEVFEDHLSKRNENDLEGDLKCNYAPDILLLTCTGVLRGHEGVRRSHKILMESLPDASIECFNRLVDGEFAFLEWRAMSSSVEVREGVDSFVIRDGKIRFQSIHYKVHPVSRSDGNSNGPTFGVQTEQNTFTAP
jgi:hypothetical protein